MATRQAHPGVCTCPHGLAGLATAAQEGEALSRVQNMTTLHVTATGDTIQLPGYYSGCEDRVNLFKATGTQRSTHKVLAVFKDGSHSMFTDRAGDEIENPGGHRFRSTCFSPGWSSGIHHQQGSLPASLLPDPSRAVHRCRPRVQPASRRCRHRTHRPR